MVIVLIKSYVGALCRSSFATVSCATLSRCLQTQKSVGYLWLFSAMSTILFSLENTGITCSPLTTWFFVTLFVVAGTCSHYYWDVDCYAPSFFFHRVESFYAAVDYMLVMASVWALGVRAYTILLKPMLLFLSALFIAKRVLKVCLLEVGIVSSVRDLLLALVLIASLYCYFGGAPFLQHAPLRCMQFLPDMGFFICLCYYETPDSHAMFRLSNIASWPKYLVYLFF